jgi:hypothetical protein
LRKSAHKERDFINGGVDKDGHVELTPKRGAKRQSQSPLANKRALGLPETPTTPRVDKGKRRTVDNEADGGSEAGGSESEYSVPPTPAISRTSLQRQVNKNNKPFNFSKRYDASIRDSPFGSDSFEPPKLYIDKDVNGNPIPVDFPRCLTCCKPLVNRIWYNKAFFDYCDR